MDAAFLVRGPWQRSVAFISVYGVPCNIRYNHVYSYIKEVLHLVTWKYSYDMHYFPCIFFSLWCCRIHFSWWRHQMETFSALLALCAGNSPVTGEFPTQRPVTQSLMFSLICAWRNGWVNSGEAGDLRRHGAHYDVAVMWVRNSTVTHTAGHTPHSS